MLPHYFEEDVKKDKQSSYYNNNSRISCFEIIKSFDLEKMTRGNQCFFG